MEVDTAIVMKNPLVSDFTVNENKATINPSEPFDQSKLTPEHHDKSNYKAPNVTAQKDSYKSREEIRESYLVKQKERRKKIFELAYEEAIRREKLVPKPKKLSIHLHCETKFGENVFLVGSHPSLGNWRPHDSIPLSWNPGNIWTCTLAFTNTMIKSEFKFIIKQSDNIIWESCDNHTFRNHQIAEASETKIHLKWNSSKY